MRSVERWEQHVGLRSLALYFLFSVAADAAIALKGKPWSKRTLVAEMDLLVCISGVETRERFASVFILAKLKAKRGVSMGFCGGKRVRRRPWKMDEFQFPLAQCHLRKLRRPQTSFVLAPLEKVFPIRYYVNLFREKSESFIHEIYGSSRNLLGIHI